MTNKTYLTDVNIIFKQDLQDPNFTNDVQAKMNQLSSAVTVRKEREANGLS